MSETYKVAKYENVSGHETRLDTLEAGSATEGSVAKTVKDAVDPVKGTGWTDETVKGNADAIALRELLSNKKSTLSENSETYYPNQKAVNDGLATKLDVDLSGNITPTGIYLGGTGSANLLDDYEEGTWTPTLEASTTNPTVDQYLIRTGKYTKIGNTVIVHCTVRATISNIGSGTPRVTGLPFLSVNNFSSVSSGRYDIMDDYNNAIVYIINQEVRFQGASYNLRAMGYITFSAVYETTL